ncbi:MAG: hypothetical protein PHC62_00260 [Candidatus Izemoplasmatales bacterium]|nr:hypothetical protein [Candidatus Izemoplasmatales bacterium]
MAFKYKRQQWKNYNANLEASDQPEAIVTKARLDNMESGIEQNSMELSTKVSSDATPGARFVTDLINKRRVLEITFPIISLEAATRFIFGGVKAKDRTNEDMEVSIGQDGMLYTGILRSPNGSKFKLVVDDNGNLSTERIL